MDNKSKKRRNYYLILLFFIIITIAFIIFNKDIGLIGIIWIIGTLVFSIILSSYYFRKYLNSMDIYYDYMNNIVEGNFNFPINNEYILILNNIKILEKNLSSIFESILENENLSEREYKGLYQEFIKKYNKLNNENKIYIEKMENDINQINRQVDLLIYDMGSIHEKDISIREYRGKFVNLVGIINTKNKEKERELNTVLSLTEGLLKNTKPYIPKGEYTQITTNIHNNINKYIDNNDRKLKEINKALDNIIEANENLIFNERYMGDYYSIKYKLEKISSEYNKALNKIKDMQNNNKPRKRSTNRGIPKTPKGEINLDHIFESRDYGKYSK